nr:hypothetical protein [Bathymodiolus platifrons methanotrophic gill symbiont]
MGEVWSKEVWQDGDTLSVPIWCERSTKAKKEINRLAKPGETKAAVVARLTGTLMSDFSKPGESWGDAKERKKSLKYDNHCIRN